MADPMRKEDVILRDGHKVHVRPSTLNDAEPLLDNINRVCAEEVYLLMDQVPYDLEAERQWLSEFDGERNVLFVATTGGDIVGQADCHGGEHSKTRHAGLIGIAVRDRFREIGLGKVLMARVLEWMQARGFKKAHLSVFATNTRARRLYESLGFEVEGVRRRQFQIRGEFVDEIIMGLWLGL